MTHDYTSELSCAVRAAGAAGTLLRDTFHSGEPEIDHRAEEEIRKILAEAFPQYGYRGEELGLVSAPGDSDGHLWLVDPNDGTAAFEKGFRGAAVSIALLRDGRPVLGVVYAYCAPDDAGDWFTWAEGTGSVKRNGSSILGQWADAPETVLVSHHADRNPQANASLAAPMRFRAVPSIAYRLALVASGEARAGVSLNGPVGWDYAGGHALLLGAGMDLYDQAGEPVRYDRNGGSSCGGLCIGGSRPVVQELVGQDWGAVLRRSSQTPAPYSLSWPKRGCMVSDFGLLSRAQGCLLGQLAGDSLGSLVEFQSATDIHRSHPGGVRHLRDGGTFNTLAGQPTDDSEMALILARSILQEGTYTPEAAARGYAWWYESHPFDIGTTTRTALAPAAKALDAGQPPADAARRHASIDSQANGALMRLSPLGIFAAGSGSSAAIQWARADALLTHPNSVCQDANAVFASAIAFAIRTGEGAQAVHSHALSVARDMPASGSVLHTLEEAVGNRPADYMRNKGWVLVALQNAFWQLLHAKNLEEGVVNTVMAGGDTDTNAAIAGALLGAVHGRSAIPLHWLDRVLSCRPISGIGGVMHPRPEAFWPVDVLWIAEQLVWLGARPRTNSAPKVPCPVPDQMGTSKGAETAVLHPPTQSGVPENVVRSTLFWDGAISGMNEEWVKKKDRVGAAVEGADWEGLLSLLHETPDLLNAVLRRRSRWFHVLHEVARCHAPVELVCELVRLGAFLTVRDSSGRRPVDVAIKEGFRDLIAPLEPRIERDVNVETLARVQELFHGLIRSTMVAAKVHHEARLPELSVLTEVDNLAVWFPIPGMYGGFNFWLDGADHGIALIAESWCRIDGDTNRHRITSFEVISVDEG